MAKQLFNTDIEVDGKIIKKDGTASQILMADGSIKTSVPASDVYAWAKAVNKPTYTAAEVGAAASSHTHTGYYKNDDRVMTKNSFGGRRLYNSQIDNAFFLASDRFSVTALLYNKSDDSIAGSINAATIFDGDYDARVIIPAGKYLKVHISNFGSTYFPGFPYGWIRTSFYHTYVPESFTLRVNCNYEPHGLGWHTISSTNVAENPTSYSILEAYNGKYNISEYEIIVTAKDTSDAYLTMIDYFLVRPTVQEMPYFNKYEDNFIYKKLIFKGQDGTKFLRGDGTFGTIITKISELSEDSSHRTVTDTEKATWNGKENAIGVKNTAFNKNFGTIAGTVAEGNHNHDAAYEPKNVNIQTHIASAHAPSDAQKNSDITKAEIEAKLIGAIATHTHPAANITESVTKRFVSDAEKTNWNSKADASHNHDSAYAATSHSHLANEITETAQKRFVSDTEKSTWNGKADASHTHSTLYEPKNSNIQTHIASAHAPSNAQKNSDITKAEIEAKLTGDIATHSHTLLTNATNTNSPNNLVKRDVSGNFAANVITVGNITSTGYGSFGSDKRLKSDFSDIDTSLFDKIEYYKYWRKDLNKWQYGVIADEIKEFLPELVSESGEDKIKHVSYIDIIAIQGAKIKELESRLNHLEDSLAILIKNI